MNDPAAIEPPVPDVEAGSTAHQGFGSALAQARIRAGLSVEQVAARLRLHPKQVEALEREEFERLPAPAYVSGFVRNYGRELKLDTSVLLEDVNSKLKFKGPAGGPTNFGPGGGEVRVQRLDDRGWRQMVLAAIVLALVCAGLIGTWIAHPGVRAGQNAARAVPTPAASAPTEPAAPTATATQTAGAGEAPAQGAPPGAGSPAPSAPAPDASAPAGAAPPAKAAAGLTPAPAGGAPPAKAGAGLTPAPAAAGPALAPGGPAAGGGPPGGLVLRFSDRSWFEVSRPDGQVLLSRNGEAGSMELLNTSSPLRLVLGRAEAVQVEYRGRPVDLKPYVNSNGVARLMLADGRVTNGGQNDHERP